MENLGDVRDLVLKRLNKDQTGGYVSPDDFNTFLPAASTDLFKKRYGLPEVPNAPEHWQANQKITDDLGPFIVTMGEDGVDPLQVSAEGYASFPSDYVHLDSIKWRSPKNNGKETAFTNVLVEMVENSVFETRVSSLRKQPTLKDPIATIRNGKLRFSPKKMMTVNMSYLRTPVQPFFDYNIVNDQVIYLPPGEVHDGSVQTIGTASASVELDWPNDVWNDLVNLVVDYAAVALKNMVAIQSSQQKKATGV